MSERISAMIDSVKADTEAADWENGPVEVEQKPFKGITNPAGCNNRENYGNRRIAPHRITRRSRSMRPEMTLNYQDAEDE